MVCAIELPRAPGAKIHPRITVALGNLWEISNVIDDAGGPASTEPKNTPRVTEFP